MNFGEVGRSLGNRVLETVGRAASRVQESRPLPTDVLENEEAYLVVFDAPGASKTDVQVRYVEGAVEVRIDRFREFYDDYEMRVPGRGMSLDGRARLPDDAVVEAEESSATLRANGTLEVHVPKGERDAELDTSAGTVDIAAPDDGEDDTERDVEESDVEESEPTDEFEADEAAGFEDEDDPADV